MGFTHNTQADTVETAFEMLQQYDDLFYIKLVCTEIFKQTLGSVHRPELRHEDSSSLCVFALIWLFIVTKPPLVSLKLYIGQ